MIMGLEVILPTRGLYFRHLGWHWSFWKNHHGCNIRPKLPCSTNILYMSSFKHPVSPEATRTVKVFQPAFKESESAKVETQEREAIQTESQNIKANPTFPKVRTLGKIDKLILVKIGKYEKISDVPDQVVVGDMKKQKEVDEEIKHLFLGSVFKYLYFFEYASFFITFLILGFSLYWYNKLKTSPATGSTGENTGDLK